LKETLIKSFEKVTQAKAASERLILRNFIWFSGQENTTAWLDDTEKKFNEI